MVKEAFYEAVIVPALHEIQHEHGYLERDAMERFAAENEIPLYRLQAVASFFPHFQLTPPKAATVRVCRDMACHLAGSAEMLEELRRSCGDQVTVQGVSCVGRCDRPAAACISLRDHGHEHYFNGRTAAELKKAVAELLAGHEPRSDKDADLPYPRADWQIDIYAGEEPTYSGVKKAVQLRDAALNTAKDKLRTEFGWDPSRCEQFVAGATRQLRVNFEVPDEVATAIRQWQCDEEWAKGEDLGGWSEKLLQELKAADLRGLGGAGIPSIQKWRDIRDAIRRARTRDQDDRGFIVVNGDESEPGTFKDREILLRNPHTVIEGVIIAGLLTEASQGFIYIRHEYPEQIDACNAAIAEAEKLGVCGKNAPLLGRSFPVSVFVSPGGYICGEQSALIEAMSDRRGEPRNMPPKLETNGLLDLPTLVSNVETYAWAPYICVKGGATYAQAGLNGWQGRRYFSVSGDVVRPGVYEVPMGMPLRELLLGADYCQGIAGGKPLKALAPSGPSGGFIPARLTSKAGLPRKHTEKKEWQELCARCGIDPASNDLDILNLELELNLFRAISPTQALGAGMVVYAEGRDMLAETLNSLEFYRNETCGKCVPCRIGSQKLVSLMTNLRDGKVTRDEWETNLLPVVTELGRAIELSSICGLGRSVPVPIVTLINFFPQDLAKHLR